MIREAIETYLRMKKRIPPGKAVLMRYRFMNVNKPASDVALEYTFEELPKNVVMLKRRR